MDRLNYVYLVARPDGRPLYVGKGSGARCKRHDARAASNPHYKAVLDKAGGKLPVALVASGLSEAKAFALERMLTTMIGIESDGGPLVNCGHGGREGPVGVKRSEKWRTNSRLKAIKKWRDETYRAKMLRSDRARLGNKGPRTAEFKSAVAAKLKGNTNSLGFKHSDASKEKMKSRWDDPVWKAA